MGESAAFGWSLVTEWHGSAWGARARDGHTAVVRERRQTPLEVAAESARLVAATDSARPRLLTLMTGLIVLICDKRVLLAGLTLVS